MSEEKKNTTYSSEDIHLYLTGKLTPSQMHAMEREALNDPLLADAMEGYETLPGFKDEKGFIEIQSDLAALKQKIGNPNVISIHKNRWWQVAAAVLIIGGAFALYIFNKDESKNTPVTIAQNNTSNGTDVKPSFQPVIKDTTLFDNTEKKKLNAAVATEEKPNTIAPNSATREFTVTNENTTSGVIVNNNDGNVNNLKKNQIIKHHNNAEELAENNTRDDNYYTVKDNVSAYQNNAQNFSGKIVDDNANAVPYADIIINNKQESKTDANGMFNINLNDSVAQITAVAKNYRATTTNIASGSYNTITLSPKKIVFKKTEEDKIKKAAKAKQLHRSIVTVLSKNNAEPKDGWVKFQQSLINLLSGSEYDDGKPVIGGMLISFEINANLVPDKFFIEESINSDVDEAIESLLKNEFEWKAIENKSLPGTIKLKIIF